MLERGGRTRDSHAAGEASRSPRARRWTRGWKGGGREGEREGGREGGRKGRGKVPREWPRPLPIPPPLITSSPLVLPLSPLPHTLPTTLSRTTHSAAQLSCSPSALSQPPSRCCALQPVRGRQPRSQWVVHASRRALPLDIPLLDDGLDLRDIRLLAAGLVSRHFPLRSSTPLTARSRRARRAPHRSRDRGTLPRQRPRPTCPAHRARGVR